MRSILPLRRLALALCVPVCRIALLVSVITSPAYAGEKTIISTNFAQGDLGGWTTHGGANIVNGKGLQSSARLDVVNLPLDFPVADGGTAIFKAKICPTKNEDDGWIAIGFYPEKNKGNPCGPVVLLRSIGTSVLSGHEVMQEGGKELLGHVGPDKTGERPYSVELSYSTESKTVTVVVNGATVLSDVPVAFNGIAGEAVPENFLSFAGIVFFNQNTPADAGYVERATLEWIPKG